MWAFLICSELVSKFNWNFPTNLPRLTFFTFPNTVFSCDTKQREDGGKRKENMDWMPNRHRQEAGKDVGSSSGAAQEHKM